MGPCAGGVLTADAIAGFEPEAYGFAMSDEMRTELNERMRHLRLQIKYQMLLSKHYLKPFENLSEAIHHARACGGVDLSGASVIRKIHEHGNAAKHHNLCKGAPVYAKYNGSWYAGRVLSSEQWNGNAWYNVDLGTFSYWFTADLLRPPHQQLQ